MDIAQSTAHLELRIKGKKFRCICMGAETRLDTSRRAFTVYTLQLVECGVSAPLTPPFHRRYHQFRQLSQHLDSYQFEHPPVPNSGGIFNGVFHGVFNTSTTEWLVEKRKKSLIIWINALLDAVEITAVRGRQKARSRLGLEGPLSPTRNNAAALRILSPRPTRFVRKAARAIMAFLHPRAEIDPGGLNDLAMMPPTPQSSIGSLQDLHALQQHHHARQRRRSDDCNSRTAEMARVTSLMASWSPGTISRHNVVGVSGRDRGIILNRDRVKSNQSRSREPSVDTLGEEQVDYASIIGVRPIASNDDNSTIISTNIFIHAICNIVPDGESTYEMDLSVTMRWSEPRLSSFNHPNDDDTVIDLTDEEGCWNPNIEISNADSVEEVSSSTLFSFRDNMTTSITRWRVECRSDSVNLRRFPFDAQSLPLRIESATHTSNEVIFTMSNSAVKLASTIRDPLHGNAEWRVDHAYLDVKETLLEFDGTKYSTLILVCQVQRKAGYYVKKIMLVMWLIQIIAWSTFAMDPSSVGTRISITAEAGLCVVSFNMLIAESLPNLPYLSQLDYFTSVIFWSVALTVAEHVVSFRISRSPEEGSIERAMALDCLTAFTSIFFSTCSLLFMLYEWRLTWSAKPQQQKQKHLNLD